jgi:hypothetical protein
LATHHLSSHPLEKVLRLLQATCGSIFSGQYFSGMGSSEETDIAADDLIDLSTDWNASGGNRYPGGKLWKKLSPKQIRKKGFIQNLCNVPPDHPLLTS